MSLKVDKYKEGFMSYKKRSNGTHTVYLGHGQMVAMASDGKSGSFQRNCVHRVPECKTSEGWRMSATIRTLSDEISDPMLIEGTTKITLGEGCHLLMFKENYFTAQEIQLLQQELLETVERHAESDVTKMFGNTFLNQGRKVMEMANENGMQYSYGGKTTKPGLAFTPKIREILISRMSQIYGVSVDKLWIHVVYYPTGKCKLDWHDDGETGINPNLIASVTWLENPAQPRPFQVRLKSTKKKPKTAVAETDKKRAPELQSQSWIQKK